MIRKGFIIEVMKCERITLGRTEDRFLNRIGIRGSETAYSIYLFLKEDINVNPPEWVESKSETVSPMAYKNVHKTVKKLESLGLIEQVQGESLPHKAIRYRLTSRGLFQCLQKAMVSAAVVVMDMNDRYKKNIILRTILYQFFEYETIKDFRSELRLLSLGNYLQACTQAILSKVEEFRSSRFTDKEKWLADDMDGIINNEIRKFVVEIVTNIKTKKVIRQMLDSDDKEYTRYGINLEDVKEPEFKNLYPTLALANDKKFIRLVNGIKMDLDEGYKEFCSVSSV